MRLWDVRPFAPEQRCLRVFHGNQHNFEKVRFFRAPIQKPTNIFTEFRQNLLRCCWSPSGEQISAGSADRFVYVWDVSSRKILYKLPGHQGSVNETDFHPTEPICNILFIFHSGVLIA